MYYSSLLPSPFSLYLFTLSTPIILFVPIQFVFVDPTKLYVPVFWLCTGVYMRNWRPSYFNHIYLQQWVSYSSLKPKLCFFFKHLINLNTFMSPQKQNSVCILYCISSHDRTKFQDLFMWFVPGSFVSLCSWLKLKGWPRIDRCNFRQVWETYHFTNLEFSSSSFYSLRAGFCTRWEKSAVWGQGDFPIVLLYSKPVLFRINISLF